MAVWWEKVSASRSESQVQDGSNAASPGKRLFYILGIHS